jgi:hypothetical protein
MSRPVPQAADAEVTIAGRVFRLGAIYAGRRDGRGRPFKPRRLLRYDPDSPLPGGWVTLELVPSGRRRVMAGVAWAAWAGEPVEETRHAP